MTREEKTKRYDEALERAKKQLEEAKVFDYEEGQIAHDIRTTTYAIFPELKESEDEKMIRVICLALTDVPEGRFTTEGTSLSKVLAWLEKQKEPTTEELYAEAGTTEKEYIANTMKMVRSMREKQKEQPQEELAYRLNGLMQEYIKEGKDDAEKEHRLKCYQLFWDALEDADFFEQKEQKPDFIVPKRIRPKFAVGDTVCRPMWSDHTIREIYIDCDNPVYFCVNEEGTESHISFSEQDEWKRKERKPAEWSPTKEQMVALNWAANGILDNDSPSTGDIKASLRSLYNDLQSKSIRASSWKPSEGQMKALSETIAFAPDTFKPKCTLMTLQNDLKKL